MSYRRHGKRGHHADHHEQRDYYETPEQKLRKNIIHYGEVDPLQELPRLATQIFEHTPTNVPAVTEGFRIGVTEQPFKIPYYAALLRLLYDRAASEEATEPLGRLVLDDFWKAFREFIEKHAWREMRLCVHFFAHLTVARVISARSMYDLLDTFKEVIVSIDSTHNRSTKAALCVAEGLLIAGTVLKEDPSLDIFNLIETIQSFIEMDQKIPTKLLVQPVVRLHATKNVIQLGDTKDVLEHAGEWLSCALSVLRTLAANDFAHTADSVPQPYLDSPPLTGELFDLEAILVPPEVEEEGVESSRKGEWPQCYVRLFDDDVTPDPTTPVGYILRSNLFDMIDIFEVNRKECARLLLEYPKWTLPGTFKPKAGAPPQSPVEGKGWDLENTLIETILDAMLLLPESAHKSIYYIALITELCKAQPQSVGPAVGKSIRKLYALLADGLDVEAAHRFAEWFAVHMSNFNFIWVWKEWIPDLTLVSQHPRRSFMRRAVEYEIRLSYYDRVLRTLPEAMAEPSVQVMPESAPGPEFEYEEPESPYHEPAQGILNLLRGRAKPDDVMQQLESIRNQLSETIEGDMSVDTLLRSITVQSLLSIGSRSFSHFLNAIERYLPLLRNLAAGQITASGSPSADARRDIMSAVARVWRRSRHMILIVFDKLMQYQIVDPADVVAWTFTDYTLVVDGQAKKTFNAFQWDLLKSALDKANGRVTIQKRKVAALSREADERAARVLANENASMEVDGDAQLDAAPAGETPQLTAARNAIEVLHREQKAVLRRTMEGFLDYLAVSEAGAEDKTEVLTEKAWHNRANWEDDKWAIWETWGWFRNWVRTFAPYFTVGDNQQMLEDLAQSMYSAHPTHGGTRLFQAVWNIAVGQEPVWDDPEDA
ncbi:MIF4G like-domain-containing protein [Dichomitus squalens]|uniref:MIF4G like-domain-containing protein n=1 Tax=Dichomitus squalens TaxID=114155 RepID=A0A4Q9Q2C3_9APHY|nr:MIF4G like-domain-containing protein [Dichomitus squalens]